MAVKSILSVYSGEAAHGAGLDHAIRIAETHNAWITGSIIIGHSELEKRLSTYLSEMALKRLREIDAERTNDIRARFARRISESKLTSSFSFTEFHSDEELSVAARSFDLLVMGPHHSEAGEDHLSAHPDYVALHSGRPVVIVPDDFSSDGMADHALVVWDGRRSSARALGDALPTLEEKSKVTVLASKGAIADPNGPASPMTLLERHGVSPNLIETDKSSGLSAQAVMAQAERLGAKLIVRGAYEHCRIASELLGDPTSELIRDSSVPVLLSH